MPDLTDADVAAAVAETGEIWRPARDSDARVWDCRAECWEAIDAARAALARPWARAVVRHRATEADWQHVACAMGEAQSQLRALSQALIEAHRATQTAYAAAIEAQAMVPARGRA